MQDMWEASLSNRSLEHQGVFPTPPIPLPFSQQCPGRGCPIGWSWSHDSMEADLWPIRDDLRAPQGTHLCFYRPKNPQNKTTTQNHHLYRPSMKTQQDFV